MFKTKSKSLFIKLVLGTLVFSLFGGVLVSAQVISQGTSISIPLKVKPTSIEVTPNDVSVNMDEPVSTIQYTATAYYNYPGLNPPIPPKDVTNDPLTVWESLPADYAMVNTIGVVTPLYAGPGGLSSSVIRATYGGVYDQTTIVMMSSVVEAEAKIGGGSYTPPTPPEPTPEPVETEPTPEPIVEPEPEPVIEPEPEEPEPEEPEPEEPEPEPIEEEPAPTEPETSPKPAPEPEVTEPEPQLPPSTTEPEPEPVVSPVTTVPEPEPEPLPESSTEFYLPTPEIPENNEGELEEIVLPEEPLEGIKRGEIAAQIGNELKIFDVREDLLDRCYQDLANCTSIFRMKSRFEGIKIDDPDNLVLFPDIAGHEYEQEINDLALLGVINGYYKSVVDGQVSPFLPDQTTIRAEFYKILVTSLAVIEGDLEYPSLFYRNIYAAYLLKQANQAAQASLPVYQAFIKTAHAALSSEAIELIRSVETPFVDIKPDEFDSHWYYPIVYNRLCEKELIDCEQGSEVFPDSAPQVEEAEALIDEFINYVNKGDLISEAISDDDNDLLLNVDEKLIYLTDPNKNDSDDDGLSDGEEINGFVADPEQPNVRINTDPNNPDSDQDGLLDFDELTFHFTDPNKVDTDDDNFGDLIEVEQGTDPNDPQSFPADLNNNGIDDVWEQEYDLVPKDGDRIDGSQDSDNDGLADVLEFRYKTNPLVIDSDGDGFSDAEEILGLMTDPNNPNEPSDDPRDLPVVINNYQYGQLISDPSPMIKGVGPATIAEEIISIQILLRNEFGHELLLGETVTDAKGNFVFFPEIELNNGTYFLIAKSISPNGNVKSSEPLKITIDKSLAVSLADLEKLEDEEIPEEALITDLVLDISSEDGRPTLYGKLTEFGSRVNVTWRSIVLSSALISDVADGSFAIKAPRLSTGRHEVFVQTVRKSDNAVSRTLKISFNLNLKQAALDDGTGLTGAVTDRFDVVTGQGAGFWIVIGVIIVLIGGAAYYFLVGKD